MENKIIVYDLINRMFLKFNNNQNISFKTLKDYFCKVHRISNRVSEYLIYGLLKENYLIRINHNYTVNEKKKEEIENFIEDNYLKINDFILKNCK